MNGWIEAALLGLLHRLLRPLSQLGRRAQHLLDGSIEPEAGWPQTGGEIVRPVFSFPGGSRFQFVEPGGNELAVWSET